MTERTIYHTDKGWYAYVDGHTKGPYRSREEARAARRSLQDARKATDVGPDETTSAK